MGSFVANIVFGLIILAFTGGLESLELLMARRVLIAGWVVE